MKSRNRLFTILAALTALTAVIVSLPKRELTNPQTTQDTSESITESRPRGIKVRAKRTAPEIEIGGVQVHQKIEDAPSWAVPYGQEFWRRKIAETVQATSGGQNTTLPANVSLGDIISRVSHAFRQDDPASQPQAKSSTYVATFDGEGFRLSPKIYAGQREIPDSRPNDAFSDLAEPAPRTVPVFVEDPSTELIFRTDSIRQGGEVLYTRGTEPVSWSVLGNTAQGLLNRQQGVIEHYESGEEGVEVSWVLQQKPAGAGPLEIEAQLTGLAYAGQDETGHHFADADGNRRVQVGQVEIVDARGRRSQVALFVENSTLRVEVPAAILEQSTYPLAIDPTIGPEFGMTYCTQPYAQYEPDVASNGTIYLAVWIDLRGGDLIQKLYGARINNAGIVLDVNGLVVLAPSAPNTDVVSDPRIASNGTDFLVVWSDERDNPVPADVYGKRIKGDGTMLDGTGFPICDQPEIQDDAVVTGNPGGYLVAWKDSRNYPDTDSGDIYGAHVSSGGATPNVTPTARISDGSPYLSGIDFTPEVATDGSDYLVVWIRQVSFPDTTIQARRVNSVGSVLGSGGTLIEATGSHHGVAYSSSAINYLVGYKRNDPLLSDHPRVIGKRLSTVGGGISPVEPETVVPYDGSKIPFGAGPIVVACNGNNYLVAWSGRGLFDSKQDLFGCRITASSGQVFGDSGFTIAGDYADSVNLDQAEAAIASNGSDYLVVWMNGETAANSNPGNDIWGARVRDADGRSLDVFPVSTASCLNPIQQSPAVGSDGDRFLVVWSDNRNSATSGYDIYGTRITKAGWVEDPAGIAISTENAAQSAPDVAWNGADYLVAWTDNRNSSSSDIYGARIHNGEVQESGGILISRLASGGPTGDPAPGVQKGPRLTSNDNDYFVVWEDHRNSATIPDVYGARVNSAGTVSDTSGIAISMRATHERLPDTAYNGTDYVVVWEDNRDVANQLRIYGARVLTTGSVRPEDANGFPITSVQGRSPVIARATGGGNDGTDCLVAWNGGLTVNGALVEADRDIGTTITINSNSAQKSSPAIGALSNGYLVTWYNYVAGGNNGDVYGSRVTTLGGVLDSAPSELKITDEPGNQTPNGNSVAANGTSYLVSHYDFGTLKTRANLVTP